MNCAVHPAVHYERIATTGHARIAIEDHTSGAIAFLEYSQVAQEVVRELEAGIFVEHDGQSMPTASDGDVDGCTLLLHISRSTRRPPAASTRRQPVLHRQSFEL